MNKIINLTPHAVNIITGFEAYCKGLWRKKDNALLNYLEERDMNYEDTDGRKQ